jgi:hypothetical protein
MALYVGLDVSLKTTLNLHRRRGWFDSLGRQGGERANFHRQVADTLAWRDRACWHRSMSTFGVAIWCVG